MKAHQKLLLSIWFVVLTLSVIVIGLYQALSATVLDSQFIKRQMSQSGAYATIRDGLVADQLVSRIENEAPGSNLVNTELVKEALKEAVSAEQAETLSEPAIEAASAWLNGETTAIKFTLATKSANERFVAAFEDRILQKLDGYESCRNILTPARQAILYDGCLPLLVSKSAAARTIADSVRSALVTDNSGLTVTITKAELGRFANIPSYLEVLRTLQTIAVVVFVLSVAIAVFWYRKRHALVLFGAVLCGAILLALGGYIGNQILDTGSFGVYSQTVSGLKAGVTREIYVISSIAFVSGVAGIAANMTWTRYRGKRG